MGFPMHWVSHTKTIFSLLIPQTTLAATAVTTTSSSTSAASAPVSAATILSATTIECRTIVEPTLRRGGSSGGGDSNGASAAAAADSSESETDEGAAAAAARRCFLLLVDQLSAEQQRYLSIKDIGVILERLQAKIVDVERLEREVESPDTRHWTIRATVRGDAMRELGVIYNSNYYSIGEHPGYRSGDDDDEDEEEEEDDEEEGDIDDDGDEEDEEDVGAVIRGLDSDSVQVIDFLPPN